MKEIKALMQLAGGTEVEWNLTEIPIPTGVLAYAIDTKVFKIGNGTTLFKNLSVFFDASKMADVTTFKNSFPTLSVADANKIIVVNGTGTGYVVSDFDTSDLVKLSDLVTELSDKADIDHTHISTDITNIKSAALKEAGYEVGQVPIIGEDNKLPSTIVPLVSEDNTELTNVLSYLLTAQLAADDAVRLNLPNGYADEFNESTGIDLVDSVNETYDPEGYFTGINMDLVSVDEILDANPETLKLYFNAITEGIPNKTLLAEMSRDGGVTWSGISLEKQRMETPPIKVFTGSTQFDSEISNDTVDLTTATLEDVKGDITTFIVDTADVSGHFDASLDPKYRGYLVTLSDSTTFQIHTIDTDGTATDEVTMNIVLATGSYTVSSITGIEIDGTNLRAVNNELSFEPPITGLFTLAENPDLVVSDHATAVIGNDMYIIGGYNAIHSAIYNGCYKHNQSTGLWTHVADLEVERRNHTAVTINDKIYVFGGLSDSGRLNDLLEYDPQSNTWTTKAVGPDTLEGHAAVAGSDGKMYVYGGNNGTTYQNKIYSYDPNTDTWDISLTDGPFLSAYHTLVSISDKVYLYGGWNGVDYLNNLYSYDIGTDTWNGLAVGPGGRRDHAGESIGGKMYIICGNDGVRLDDVYEYDPAENTWAEKTSMNRTKDRLTACVVGGKIHIYGGYDGTANAYSRDIHYYDHVRDIWYWKHLNNINIYDHAAVSIDNKIYILGGKTASDRELNSFRSYDTITHDWAVLYPYHTKISHASMVAVGTDIYVYGGVTGGTVYNNELWKYDTINDTWTELSNNFGEATSHQTMVHYGGYLYVYGGKNGLGSYNTVYRYGIASNTWNSATANGSDGDGRYGHIAVVSGGKMYIYGGSDELDHAKNNLFAYNMSVDTWEGLTSNIADNKGRIDHCGGIINNILYIYGGQEVTDTDRLRSLYSYNIGTDSWSLKDNNPFDTDTYGRISHACSVVNNKLYIYGGVCHTQTNDIITYDLVDGWNVEQPPTLHNTSAAEYNGNIYLYGGEHVADNMTKVNTLYRYDIVDNEWVALSNNTSDNAGRHSHAAVVIGSKMYVYGGYFDTTPTGTMYEYDFATDTWSPLASSVPKADAPLVTYNDKIYAYGGVTTGDIETNTLYEYDPVGDSWTELTANTSIPNGIREHGVIVIGSKMYSYGGINSIALVHNTMWEYDFVGDSWSSLGTNAYDPNGRRGMTVGITEGLIYLMGGITSTDGNIYSITTFDPSDNSFDSRFNLTNKHYKLTNTTVLYGSDIWIYGGITEGQYTDYYHGFIRISTQTVADTETIILTPATAILGWTADTLQLLYSDGIDIDEIYGALRVGDEFVVYDQLTWKTIAKDDGGIWKYVDSVGTWHAAVSNTAMSAVSTALTYTSNKTMTLQDINELRASVLNANEISALVVNTNIGIIEELSRMRLVSTVIPEGTNVRYRIKSTDNISLSVTGVRVKWN